MANSSNNRVSLRDRRAQEQSPAPQGVDAIITASPAPEATSDRNGENGGISTAANGDAGSGLSKVTLYVRPEQVLAIEEIQVEERRRTGKRRDKSDLIQEALDLLIQKYRTTVTQ